MRVAVAMSGGVDSSVAAYLLKKQGYEVVGMTIKTWPKEECGASGEKLCCSLEAVQMARSVAEDLDIPYYVINLSKEFNREITEYFIEEYKKGRTPNPCIHCNSKIKFGYLLEKVKKIGAEKLATGHFARIVEKDGKYLLAEGKDEKKDQTYFLYEIAKDKLKDLLFPLGDYTKEEVREIAMEQNFMTAARPSSQDICFATSEGDYRKFLSNRGIKIYEPGDIIDSEGNIVGEHNGIANFTVGQRKGIGLARPNPVYVTKIDPVNNTITVGEREEAMIKKVRVAGFNWFIFDELKEKKEFDVKVRYATSKIGCYVSPSGKNEGIVEFKEPKFAPAPGQAAVFYDGDIVAGGAWIEEIIED